MKLNNRSRFVLLTVLGFGSCLFLMHFFLTFLHLSPINPVKAAIQPIVQNHHRDLFAQNWSLFAPNPIHNNTALLVKCLPANQEETEWYNINQGIIEEFQQKPLGAFARLSRLHLTAVRYYQGFSDPTNELIRQRICDTDPENVVCTREDENTKYTKDTGEKMLVRLGSAACNQIVDVRQDSIMEVKIRVLNAPVRPYSERNNPDWKPSVSGFETEWLPYEQVAPLNYRLLSEEKSL